MKKKRTVADVIDALTSKKTIKAWAAMYRDGNIFQPATLLRIWVQKTKPKVFKDGVELYIVPITITYTLPSKPKQ